MQPTETPSPPQEHITPAPPATPASAAPVMDVVAPPPPEEKSDSPADSAADKKKPEQPVKATAKQVNSKQPGSGIGLAIFATVIIVLGLAALVTYAYLKTK